MTGRSVLACTSLALAGVLGSAAVAQSVEVELLHFGVGDIARGGGPIAVQLQFRSGLDRVAEIEAVWEIPNADLDIVEHARRFVLNPGQAQKRWLYGVLPPWAEGTLQGAVFDLRLYELEGGERARDLGAVKIAPANAANPPRVLGLADDAFLVVGPRAAGLDIYAQLGANGAIASMNAATVIANARDAEAFPDRWDGLAVFDSIVWADGAVAPSRLSEEAARAVEQWTERGGNFVIALPSAGDPWSVGVEGRHRFSALLPSVAPTRVDDVPVSELIQMLSVSDALRDPKARTRLAVFDATRLDRGWRPFIATPSAKAPDGRPAAEIGPFDAQLVGVRRELGFGKMTLLGLDVEELSSRALQVPPLPQGDVFWNRILGRRADTPSGAEYTALAEGQRLVNGSGFSKEIGDGKSVSETIGLSGQAAVGVLAATAVFGLYWLVAGPLGFAALKALKRERWAWVAYVGVAAVFTGAILAVGGGLSGQAPRASHLTVLDIVERAPGESDITQSQRRRATSWLSVYAPSYGEVEVALDPEGDPALRNMLSSWRPVGSSVEGFPSRERYTAPLDSPNRALVPSRATTVDFKADWMGALRDGWGQVPRVESPVQATIDTTQATPTISLSGTLVHRLPGPLTDVKVIHIWPRQNPLQALGIPEQGQLPTRRFQAPLPNRGAMVDVADWAPGAPLDLAKVFPDPRSLADRVGLERAIEQRYYLGLEQQLRSGFGIVSDSVKLQDGFDMLSLYGMLQPPRYLRSENTAQGALRIARVGGRELDLSRWFAQPCLIVTGWLEQSELPYDFRLDGDPIESAGRVLVRWMMPLPAESHWIVPEKFPRAGRRPE
jgi:hypothetical protein